jgi:hypothetical protein
VGAIRVDMLRFAVPPARMILRFGSATSLFTLSAGASRSCTLTLGQPAGPDVKYKIVILVTHATTNGREWTLRNAVGAARAALLKTAESRGDF